METVLYSLPLRLFGLLILIGWSAKLAEQAFFPTNRFPLSRRTVFTVSLLLFVLFRLLYSENREQNVDTSTWIATALTIGKSSDPLHTFFNYSDGRPLAILPLALVELVGIPVDYQVTNFICVLLWCLTLWLFWRILIRHLDEKITAILVWFPMLLLNTLAGHDFISFNTEVTGNLWLILALFLILRFNYRSVPNALGIGFLLGCLPFVKFQTVPMGIVFGLFTSWKLYQSRQFGSLLGLFAGALLPVTLLAGYYAAHDELDAFWGDYFSNYFVYSYTTEYSTQSAAYRFSPYRIVKFIFYSYQTFVYWLGMLGGVLVGIWLYFRQPVSRSAAQKERLWFGLCWFLASLYAVLQAGNDYNHYLLFLVFPILYLGSVYYDTLDVATGRQGMIWVGSLVALQAIVNTVARTPLDTHPCEPLFQAISTEIVQRSGPDDGLVVWGYVDRLHSYSRRPMGYRGSNTFWVYYPTSTRQFREQQFLEDLEKNQPRLFVDAISPRISVFSDSTYYFQRFPAINTYINQHYRLVKTIEDVRIFERIKK